MKTIHPEDWLEELLSFITNDEKIVSISIIEEPDMLIQRFKQIIKKKCPKTGVKRIIKDLKKRSLILIKIPQNSIELTQKGKEIKTFYQDIEQLIG